VFLESMNYLEEIIPGGNTSTANLFVSTALREGFHNCQIREALRSRRVTLMKINLAFSSVSTFKA
jgi:hypothetical protein